MFGYVTVAKNQLTEEEYRVFCGYYCGVCKATGKCASQLCRLGLSYDITFLAIVLSSLLDDKSEIKDEHCIVHHIKKRPCLKNDAAVNYAASVGVLLQYLKLADDLHDDKSIKALLGMTLFRRGYAHVKKNYANELAVIKQQLSKLSRLENGKCPSIDETADCFAKLLEALFTPSFITDESQKRMLAWFGYNLGRWIYIIDAFSDLEDDIQSGSYNPLKEEGETKKSECAAKIEPGLSFTLANIASAFDLMDFKKNKSIVGKMVYTSLRQKQKSVLTEREGTK